MPRGGQNRKPRQQKIIEGTFRKDRNPEREPSAPALADPPKPPAGLNRWAKKLWKQLAPALIDNGVLTEIDLPAFEACCMQYGLYRELLDAITHYTDDRGKRHKQTVAEYLAPRNSQTMPEYASMRQAFSTFNVYLQQFGLTPASRNRIDLGKGGEKEVDPMEELLNEA